MRKNRIRCIKNFSQIFIKVLLCATWDKKSVITIAMTALGFRENFHTRSSFIRVSLRWMHRTPRYSESRYACDARKNRQPRRCMAVAATVRRDGVDATRTRALRSFTDRRVTVTVTLRGLDTRYRAGTVGAQRSSLNERGRRREKGEREWEREGEREREKREVVE